MMSIHRREDPIRWDDMVSITNLLHDFPEPWFVCGGWAIDLFLGRVTRTHDDLEIGLPRDRQMSIQTFFRDWSLYKFVDRPGADAAIVAWREGEYLDLPIHQVLLRPEDQPLPEFEFFLNEVEHGTWRFRRLPSISRPFVDIILTSPQGIPHVAPEIQLLYKSRLPRPKDELDFEATLNLLDGERRGWLYDAITAFQPTSPWLGRLSTGSVDQRTV